MYLDIPIGYSTGRLLVAGAGVLDGLLGPQGVQDGWNEGIDQRLQEALVDPQQDRNHNTRNAHHDWRS